MHIKDFEEEMDDESLKVLFSQVGKTLSVKVMRDPSGKSKGFGVMKNTRMPIRCGRGEWKRISGKVIFVGCAPKKNRMVDRIRNFSS